MAGWTSEHQELLERFAERFPCPGGPGLDDEARDWTRRVAEQFAFTFPSEGWGHKAADATRPPSTDVIATRSPFQGYDLIERQGRSDWKLAYMPGVIPLPGQRYIDVSPFNHLGDVVEPPGPGPVPPPTDLELRVAELEQWARNLSYQK